MQIAFYLDVTTWDIQMDGERVRAYIKAESISGELSEERFFDTLDDAVKFLKSRLEI